jgi:hypothetical protein
MTNQFPTRPATPLPSRDAAFVVHLTTAPDEPVGEARGRVEHVATGRAARFESADALVRFMRETLAAIAADGR